MVGKATTTVFRPRASGADPTEPGKGAKSLSCVRSVVFPLIALPRHSSKNSTASTVSSSSCSPLETTLSSESFYSCEEGEGALHELPTREEGEAAAGSLSAAEHHHEEVDRIDRKNHEEVDRIDPKRPHKTRDDTNLRFAEEIRLFKKERELNSAELEKRRAELKILRCRLGEKTAANATRPASPSAKMCKRLRRNHQQQQQPSDERSAAFLEYQIGMAQIEMLRLQRQEIFLVQQERELRREARRLMRVQQQRSNDAA